MKKFTIHDYELERFVNVEAPGFIEAIFEYLPWSSLQLECEYSPTFGKARFVDRKTMFIYEVVIL